MSLIFDVAIRLDLKVVGRSETNLVAPKDALVCIFESDVGRKFCRVVDGVGQNSRLFGLAFLINPQECMTEHGGRIVHKGRGENEADSLGVQLGPPPVETITCHRHKPTVIKSQTLLQPVISGNEGTLGRLFRAANKSGGEKELDRRFEFSLRIVLPLRRQEKPLVILLTGHPSQEIFLVMQQQAPFACVC